MSPETNPTKIRQVYPQMPKIVGRLLSKASEGDRTSIDQLGEIIEEADYIEPWHEANLRGIFRTNYDLPDRERLALDTISTLDKIKERAQPGQPFMVVDFQNSWLRVYVGTLGEDGPDFRTYPGISLREKATILTGGHGLFPDFSVQQGKASILLTPASDNRKGAWDFLQDLTKGVGRYAIGNDHIDANIAHQKPQTGFYSALTLDISGLSYDVSKVNDDVRERAGLAMLESLTSTLLSQLSTDKVSKLDIYESIHHKHSRPERENSLSDAPLKYVRSVLRVVGLDEGTIRSELTGRLDQIASSETSTIPEIAGAMAAKQIVGSIAEVVTS